MLMSDSNRNSNEPPVEPTMKYLHPLTMLYRAISILPSLILAYFISRSQSDFHVELILTAFFGILAFPRVVLYYIYYRYSITENEVIVDSGIISRLHRIIPFERIQNIHLNQSGLQRLLGLCVVEIETASGAGAEASLQFVGKKEGERIVQFLKQKKGQLLESPSAGVSVYEINSDQLLGDSDNSDVLFRMSLRDVFNSGLLSFSGIIFGFLGFAFPLFQMLRKDFLPDDLFYFSSTDQYAWLWILAIVVSLFIVIVLTMWVGGILRNLFQYFGFTLRKELNALNIKSGLISQKSIGIRLKRLQQLCFRSNPLMRHFGMERLELATAGYGKESVRSAQVAIPMAGTAKAEEIAKMIHRYSSDAEMEQCSRKIIPRNVTRVTITLLILHVVAYFAVPNLLSSQMPMWSWAVLLFIPVVHVFSGELWKRNKVGFDDHDVFVERGVLSHTRVIIPRTRVQSVELVQSLFQRMWGLADVVVDTAASPNSSHNTIPDIETKRAQEIVAVLTRWRK